ncbi:hypothetical protein ACGFWI_07975 [Streptomyces sp. NPDC048434]|uniref:hypothetical protein n=1 Tax=Streptomyces sp. NPDC048434 TaxID=3365549 RepID=UPI003723C938
MVTIRRPPSDGSPHAKQVGKTASLRNLAIGRVKLLGAMSIAPTNGAIRDLPERAAWILGITDSPHPSGT